MLLSYFLAWVEVNVIVFLQSVVSRTLRDPYLPVFLTTSDIEVESNCVGTLGDDFYNCICIYVLAIMGPIA